MTKSVLIIDDNDDFRETCRYLLADVGIDLWDAACPKDAYPILSGERFDLIVCDLNMPFAGGKEANDFTSGYEVGMRTIKELAHVYPDTPIVALSATPSSDLKRLAKYLDPIPAFPKPTNPDDLLDLFETLAMLNSPSQIQ